MSIPALFAGEVAEAAADRFDFTYTLLTPRDATNVAVIRIDSGEYAGRVIRISVEERETPEAVPRYCENPDCHAALPVSHTAVYCSNACAVADA